MAIAMDQWRSNVFGPPFSWDAPTVAMFDQVTESVTEDQVRDAVLVSADLAQHAAWLHEYVELGFDELFLHFVGKQQQPFIDCFGESVLPQLVGAS